MLGLSVERGQRNRRVSPVTTCRMMILFLLVFSLINIATCYTYQTSWNPDYDSYQQVLPQEIMVDVINNLGLHLLAIHNDNNDNNIALSPYGAASVLVALREGVRGDAVREIHNAAHIPRDISITRVGLRDIHRHLKSYFIPKEGFLAGLTLSHDNVTLHAEYEKILHFYGYDIDSFNNALYPDPETTVKPVSTSEITDLSNKEMGATEETTIVTDVGVNEDVTQEPKTEEATTEKLTTERTTTPEVTTVVTTTTTTTTVRPDTTTKTTQKMSTQITQKITTPQVTEETTKSRPSTIKTTPEITTPTTTTPKKVPTSQTTPITTTRNPATTPKNVATTFVNREDPTTVKTTPIAQTTSKTTKIELTTGTPTLFTSQKLEDSTKNNATLNAITMSESTTTTTTTPKVVSSPTTPQDQTIFNENTESTEITTETTSNPNTEFESTPPTETTVVSANTENGEPTVKIVSRSSSPLEDLPDTKLIEKTAQFESRRLTTTTFGYEYLNTEPNIEGSWLDIDVQNDTLKESSRRDIRSVVDYVVARYYDSQNTPNKETYRPREELTFLVNGKYREGNINFMSYDTVLPFYYISHLNALALSFPLDSTKYYLLLVLPVDENGVDKLVCDLKKTTTLKHIIRSLKYTHIKAVIPSFMLKGYVILTPTLQKLGIRTIFEPRHADFSPMTNEKDIYVTNIEQAITVTIRNYVDPNSIQNHRNLYQYGPVEFKADHPFLYFVIDSEIHVTLMAGKIINPLNSRIR